MKIRLHRPMEYTATSQMMIGVAETTPTVAVQEDIESLLRSHRLRVYRFILASVRDKDAADTLTQDCFMRAHQARGRFRNDCSMETWLMQIAVNLVRDYARNRRLQFWRRTQATGKPVESLREWLSDGRCSPEMSVVLREQVQAVWDAAESLTERQRSVFLLRFVEDMDLLDIAKATGMKEGTVKAHLFRALQNIRERVGGRQ